MILQSYWGNHRSGQAADKEAKSIKSAHPPFLLWKEWCPFQSFQNHHHDDRLWQPKNNAAVDLFISWWITTELNSLWQTCLYQCNDRCWDFITNIRLSRPSIFCITVRIPWVHLKEKQTKHINLFEAPEHINLFQHQGGHLWKWVQCLVELLVRAQALVVLPNNCSFVIFLPNNVAFGHFLAMNEVFRDFLANECSFWWFNQPADPTAFSLHHYIVSFFSATFPNVLNWGTPYRSQIRGDVVEWKVLFI